MTDPPAFNQTSESAVHDRPTQRETRWLIGIVAAAACVRLFLLVFRRLDLHTDPDAYVALAETIRATGGFHVPGTDVPTAFRPPLYPASLALLTSLGMRMSVSVGLISVCCGAITTIVSWWLARAVSLRGWWPVVVAGVTAFDPLLLRYSTLPMTEVPSAALMSVAALLVLRMIMQNNAVHADDCSRYSRRYPIRAGIVFALAGFCRPVCFVACGLMAVGTAWQLRSSGLRQVAKAFVPVAICGIALLPWVIRNAVALNAFVPLTTHGGYTLLLGNNEVFYRDVVSAKDQPVWTDESFREWEHNIQSELTAEDIHGEVAVDRWMMTHAIKTISANSNLFVQACVLRWKRFWAIRPEVEGKKRSAWVVWAVGTWYGLLWVGLAVSVFQIPKKSFLGILWLAIVGFLLVHTFYWTNARMRAPVTAMIAVLSISGWRTLIIWSLSICGFGKGKFL